MSSNLFDYAQNKKRSGMAQGAELQREPYKYLLSQSEKQYARNLPFRMAFNGLAVGATAVYHLSRHNQLGRVRALSISFDMVFGVAIRSALALVVADQFGRRLFCNYVALRKHEMAEYEVKKIMRTFPDPKPHVALHDKPNSYFWC